MWVYVIRRALLLVPVIIGVMTVTFAIVSAVDVSDKLTSFYGPSKIGYSPQVPCSEVGQTGTGLCPNPAFVRGEKALGLDQPIEVQWGKYIYNSLTLNWGQTDARSQASTTFGIDSAVPVTTVLGWYLPYTLELGALALTIILLLAIPIGNYSAVYRNRPLDQGARIMSFSGFALPGFLLAVLLLFALTYLTGGASASFCGHTADAYDQWFGSWPVATCFPGDKLPSFIGTHYQTSPTGFPTVDALLAGQYALAGDTILRMIVPALVIAYGSVAGILRFVRNSMLEVMNLDFVRTARSKGVPESSVVSRHAGRNSLNVTITVLGLTFAGFIGGFPVIESVFGLKGIGLLLAVSIQHPYDYGLIFGTTLLFTIIVVIANIIVDVLYAFLDPRVRLG